MEGIGLREHIAALFTERDRAVDMAEREREKAAQTLAQGLRSAISEGDANLRSHIAGEIQRIGAAFEANELLSIQRIATIEQRIEGLQRELTITNNASEMAISKSEDATNERFKNANGFREELTRQTSTYLPRETFDSVVEGWTAWRDAVNTTLSEQAGALMATNRNKDRQQPWHIWAAGAFVTVVNIAVVLAANFLS